MANFPRYDSKRSLTTDTPLPMAPGDTKAERINLASNMLDVAQRSYVKYDEIVYNAQKTTQKANQKVKEMELLQNAENETDINALPKYKTQLDNSFKDTLKGMTNARAKADAEFETMYDKKIMEVKLDGIFRKKLVDHTRAATQTLIDTEVSNPTDKSYENIKTELSKQTLAGMYSKEEEQRILKKANDELGANSIARDLSAAATPEEVDVVRQSITSGLYETGGVTIEPDKKKNLLEIADRTYENAKKKQQSLLIEERAQNRVNTLLDISSGKTPIESINLGELSEYDPELALTLSKVSAFMKDYNPQEGVTYEKAGLINPSQVKTMRNYAESVKEVFNQNDNDSLGKFMVREFSAKGDGTTSSIKLAAFANLAAMKAKVNNPTTKEDNDVADRFRAVKNAVKYLSEANPFVSSKTINDFIVKNYLSGGSGEIEVMNEAKAVLKERMIDKYPTTARLSAMPNKIVDGESSIEDMQSGLNELQEDINNNAYSDASAE